ncbi:MAG: hypothetical protein GEU93_19405 [Propionibacteriales bacterium]|nr:hypothetical protein [Propionibacteriales bacterium]
MSVIAPPMTGTFVADAPHSTLRFSVTHMNVSTFSAVFDDVDLRVDADHRGIRLAGALRVESVSIKSPPEFREHVVYSPDFFDAGNHPEITFRSDDVDFREDGTATVRGELTIKGVTRPFTAEGTYQPPVEDPLGGVHTGVECSATVDRRDWGLNWQAPLPRGGDMLGYDVLLSAEVALVKQG